MLPSPVGRTDAPLRLSGCERTQTSAPSPRMKDAPSEQEHMLTGMVAAAGAMLLFAIMNGLAKHLSETHSVIEIAFWRN
ncbi:MAG: hypothetical protein AAGA61_02825, partial [Pseudomonadota bacterium]